MLFYSTWRERCKMLCFHAVLPRENAAQCWVFVLFFLERMLHNAGFPCCSTWRECCKMLGFHAVLPGENAAKCWVSMLFYTWRECCKMLSFHAVLYLERMLQNVEFQLWAASGLETVLHRRKPRGSCPPSAT